MERTHASTEHVAGWKRGWVPKIAATLAVSGLVGCTAPAVHGVALPPSISATTAPEGHLSYPTTTTSPMLGPVAPETSTTSSTTTTTRPVQILRPEPRPYQGDPDIARWLRVMPPLTTLARMFPIRSNGLQRFPDLSAQLVYIAQLDQELSVSVADYKNLKINTEFENAFASEPGYWQTNHPTFFVVHWSAERYTSIQDYITKELQRGYRTEFFIDRSGQIYQLFNSDNRFPAHARGANDKSQGVEIESTGTLDYTVQQLNSAILLAETFDHRNNLAINDMTILGHEAVDLFFNNSTYDRTSGNFHVADGIPPFIDKIDPPQELINVLVTKAVALNVQLGY